jgi:hypothetical protein
MADPTADDPEAGKSDLQGTPSSFLFFEVSEPVHIRMHAYIGPARISFPVRHSVSSDILYIRNV